MSLGRLIGILVVIIVIYSIVTQPVGMATMTRNGVGQLGVAGDRMVQFVSNVITGNGSTSTTRSRQFGTIPSGGVATGDGSTPIN